MLEESLCKKCRCLDQEVLVKEEKGNILPDVYKTVYTCQIYGTCIGIVRKCVEYEEGEPERLGDE